MNVYDGENFTSNWRGTYVSNHEEEIRSFEMRLYLIPKK